MLSANILESVEYEAPCSRNLTNKTNSYSSNRSLPQQINGKTKHCTEKITKHIRCMGISFARPTGLTAVFDKTAPECLLGSSDPKCSLGKVPKAVLRIGRRVL